VDTHFAQHAADLLPQLDLAAQAGFDSIRDEIYWDQVETSAGHIEITPYYTRFVEAAAQRGLHPLLVLDYGNKLYDHGDKPRSPEAIAAFTRYAVAVARRFKGQVFGYEIWNEWEGRLGSTTPGNVDDYVRLLQSVGPALKQVDPAIHVLGDGILVANGNEAGMRHIAQSGAYQWVDGVSVHPYFYNRGPDKRPEAWAAWLSAVSASVERVNGGKPVPLFVGETGWPSMMGENGATIWRQAEDAARMFLLARSLPGVAGAWWYDLRNDGTDPRFDQDNFGLLWPDGTPKPALAALGEISTLLRGTRFVGRMANDNPDIWLLRFQAPGRPEIWVLWNASTDHRSRLVMTKAGEPAAITQHAIGQGSVRRIWGREPGDIAAHLSIDVGAAPVLLVGVPTDAALRWESVPFPSDQN
jgi:hypothetical protein